MFSFLVFVSLTPKESGRLFRTGATRCYLRRFFGAVSRGSRAKFKEEIVHDKRHAMHKNFTKT
jgi:hypothetical protein